MPLLVTISFFIYIGVNAGWPNDRTMYYANGLKCNLSVAGTMTEMPQSVPKSNVQRRSILDANKCEKKLFMPSHPQVYIDLSPFA